MYSKIILPNGICVRKPEIFFIISLQGSLNFVKASILY